MTDETTISGEMPAEAAAPLPETTEPVESAPTQPETTPDDAGDDKPKGGFQRRIDELTKNWREEQRRNDALLQALMQQRPQAAPTPAPEPQQPTKPPTLEEHGYDEAKYQAALFDYARSLTRAEIDQEFQAREAKQAEQKRLQDFAARSQEFAKAHPDYVDKVIRSPTLPVTHEVQQFLAGLESGPELLYRIVNDQDMAARLFSLPFHVATMELGRLDAHIAFEKQAKPATAAKPAPVVTKAPPPPPTVETTGTESVKVSTTDPASDAMPTDEWIKAEMKRMAKKAKTHG